jgi:hypothetical protein
MFWYTAKFDLLCEPENIAKTDVSDVYGWFDPGGCKISIGKKRPFYSGNFMFFKTYLRADSGKI